MDLILSFHFLYLLLDRTNIKLHFFVSIILYFIQKYITQECLTKLDEFFKLKLETT